MLAAEQSKAIRVYVDVRKNCSSDASVLLCFSPFVLLNEIAKFPERYLHFSIN